MQAVNQEVLKRVEDALQHLSSRSPQYPVDQELLNQQQQMGVGTRVPGPLGTLGGWRWFELEPILHELGIKEVELWHYFTWRSHVPAG